MKYKMKVTGYYETKSAKDKKDAIQLALNHFYAELIRWSDGKELAGHMWEIEVEEGK